LGQKSDRRPAIVASLRGFLDERVALGHHVMAAACDDRVQADSCSLTDDIREPTDLANECRVTIFSLNGGMTVGFAPQAVRQDRRHLVAATGRVTYDIGFMVRSGDVQLLALTVTDTLGGQSSTLSWNLGVAKDGAPTVAQR
jgi:hypothetical protein